MVQKNRYFRDERNPEKLISEDQLKREYGNFVAGGSIDPSEKTFQDYLSCCMQANGGTLVEASPLKEYRFTIKEVRKMDVDIHASSYSKAREKVEQLYYDNVYELDYATLEKLEFLPEDKVPTQDFIVLVVLPSGWNAAIVRFRLPRYVPDSQLMNEMHASKRELKNLHCNTIKDALDSICKIVSEHLGGTFDYVHQAGKFYIDPEDYSR